jgi:hypothetical protein
MYKPTETIVRIGTTVGKHTEAWGSAWVARRSVAEPCGRGAEGVPKRVEGVTKRAGRSEREDARRGGGVRCGIYFVLILPLHSMMYKFCPRYNL